MAAGVLTARVLSARVAAVVTGSLAAMAAGGVLLCGCGPAHTGATADRRCILAGHLPVGGQESGGWG